MKRLLLTSIILVSAIACLFSKAFKANRLGQNIEGLDISSDCMVKEVSSAGVQIPSYLPYDISGCVISCFILYQGDVLLKKIDRFDCHDSFLLISTESDGSFRSSYFEDDLMMFEAFGDGNSISTSSNVYDNNGILMQTVNKEDDELISTDFFYRSGKDQRLSMVRSVTLSGTSDVLVSDSFLVEDGQLIDDGLVMELEDQATKAERQDENLILTSTSTGGITAKKTMNTKGQVINVTESMGEKLIYTEDYCYSSAGILETVTRKENSKSKISYYDGTSVYKEEEFVNDELKVVNQYLEGEKKQTLYEFGQPYAIVEFDEITGKIRKVTYW